LGAGVLRSLRKLHQDDGHACAKTKVSSRGGGRGSKAAGGERMRRCGAGDLDFDDAEH
jgi:hypothetical protein